MAETAPSIISESIQHEEPEVSSELLQRLDVLLEQVDRIARGDTEDTRKKSKSAAGGNSRTRLAEAEEDKRLIQDTCKDESSAGVWLSQQPACIQGGLMRSYQLEGLNWLISLYDRKINGILADEMGLGKTLQSISLVGYLKFNRHDPGPYLVICPKSTLTNWSREFERWCPGLKTIKLHGDQEERNRVMNEEMNKPFDVLITTYEVLIIEKAALRKRDWRYMLIDEAHRIKNENSVLSQAVRYLNSDFRVLITGTPLQNNLHELWALLNFLLPQIFSDSDVFDSLFASQTHSQEIVHKLHAILRPFILRRLKADVEKGLPPKKETKLYIPMTPLQKQLYASILSKDIDALNALGRAERSRLINMLMQLRKACNHPYLFTGIEPGPPYMEGPHLWESCGKLQLLHKLLIRLKAEGHRVLIFTQMTRMLDILEDYCRYSGLEYCRLDGQTNAIIRDEHIDAFNAPGSCKFVFLLSTRAGGLGVNLQTADTVIIYDSDWNPQMDLQAQDRAHRVGQTKQVRVFRFITASSVEEKIVERADKKLYLDAVVIQQGRLLESSANKLANSELQNMIRFGADEVFKSASSHVTDVDIDAILADGEQRTEELKARIQSGMQHTLSNFVFDGTSNTEATYKLTTDDLLAAESEATLITAAPLIVELGKRERTVRAQFGNDQNAPDHRQPREPKFPKAPMMSEHQFWNKSRMEDVVNREIEKMREIFQTETRLFEIEVRDEKNRKMGKIVPMDARGRTEEMLVREELDQLRAQLGDIVMEKESVTRSAFPSWTRRDFKYFILAVERYGKRNGDRICKELLDRCGKRPEETLRYLEVFFARISELENGEQLTQRFERSELRNAKRDIYNDLIKSKIAKYSYPELSMGFDGLRRIGDFFSDAEDRGIFILLGRVGYGFWDQLKEEISKSDLFRNNWFVRTRSPQELQARCDRLIRCVEREVETKHDPTKDEHSKGTLDERVPDCWYDGNTSCSENEMEVSQRRLNKVTDQSGVVVKRKRSSTSTGQPKKRSISLKLPSPQDSVKDEIQEPAIDAPGVEVEEGAAAEPVTEDVDMGSPPKEEQVEN
jgi:SWI/SNF-related matrix-associated actin-dependent regulator of chromatin subfamily A member 5